MGNLVGQECVIMQLYYVLWLDEEGHDRTLAVRTRTLGLVNSCSYWQEIKPYPIIVQPPVHFLSPVDLIQ